MTIRLPRQDAELLQRIVRQHYLNLRSEIFHTDSSLFKKRLKEEESAVLVLLEKMGVHDLEQSLE
jgi:hypothetical protein